MFKRLDTALAAGALVLTLLGAAWTAARSSVGLIHKVDDTAVKTEAHEKKLLVHDKHLVEHDIMMAKIVQAMKDAHVARINTERMLKYQEEGDE